MTLADLLRLALIVLLLPGLARAQAPVPTEKSEIEEIIVTAQKRPQSLQDVPISMSVLQGAFLAEAGIDTLHELARFTPNVHFDTSPCCSAVFIRGFGTSSNITAFDPAVGLAVDELSINQSIYLSDPLYDLERFEVLRGPQGVLFGKNTTAGLFNVTTAEPTRELTGSLAARVGGLGETRVESAISGPLPRIGDVAQIRVAGVVAHWADDVENTKRRTDGPDLRQRAGRVKLALQPLPGFEALLIGEVASTHGNDLTEQAYHLPRPDIEFLRRFDPRFEDDGFNHQNSQDFPTRIDRETNRLQANLRYVTGDFGPVKNTELVAILGYSRLDLDVPRDFDLTPADLLRDTRFGADYDQRSLELRFTATAPAPFVPGEIDFLGGLLLFDSHLVTDAIALAGDDLDEWLVSAPGFEVITGMPAPGGIGFQSVAAAAAALGVTLPSGPNPLQGDGLRIFSNQRAESEAMFGQLSWRPSERWTLSAGARLTFETKRAFLENECFQLGVVCATGGAEAFRSRLRRHDTDVSPKFSLQYHPIEALSLFAVRASGFKSGGFNNQSTVRRDVEVDPESAISWEVGAKGIVLDGKLSYGITLYQMDVDDLQLQDLVKSLVTVRNAGSARSRGVELDFEWLSPWKPFDVQGAAAFTDARFKSFPNAVAPVSSSSDHQDLSGRRLPFVPEWHVNVTPKLHFPLSNWFDLTMALDVLFQSNQYLDSDLDPNTRQNAYTFLNGRVAVSTPDGAWSLTLRGTNLTDAGVAELVSDLPIFFPGGYFTSQVFQRNWTIELAARF